MIWPKRDRIRFIQLVIAIFAVVVILGAIPASARNFNRTDEHQAENLSDGQSAHLPVADAANGSQEVFLPIVNSAPLNSWAMAGANPARTSWIVEEVRGSLDPLWYKPIEPYILQRVQIIAAYETLYVSTARGLYALDAETGAERWVYPTELPLGHSPTIRDGVAYVGGLDKKIHAIDAYTGQGLWTFEAGAGFDTSPLVVDGMLYAGNRDSVFYAIHTEGPNIGQVAWTYTTGRPIHFSAAYQDGVVYFASNDSHAYALNANTGTLVWKSEKLPGVGFHSWWPVIYEDHVIFAGSSNYRFGSYLGAGTLAGIEKPDVYPNYATDPRGLLVGPLGTEPGDWAAGTPTIDTSKSEQGSTTPVTEYLEQKPWRRTYLVLNRFNGQEYTTDFDNDGNPEYAPILWVSVDGAGNRYPPMVGADNVLYQTNNYMSDSAIPGGQISGWKLGTPFISIITSDWGAVDEPHAYAGGGNLIYWNLCCDRQSWSVDISWPNTRFADRYNSGIIPATGSTTSGREFRYFGYDLDQVMPGYNASYYGSPNDVYASFGGTNGAYGYHGDVNPPIPYQGRVYMHRGNSILAFGPGPSTAVPLPTAATVDVQDNITPISVSELKSRLETEVQKMLDAGHLKPGYTSSGILDLRGQFKCGDDLIDYWHHPGDVITTLIRALPHLPASMQQPTLDYIQSEFNAFPPYTYNHIGWTSGAPREIFDLPPEIETGMLNFPPETKLFNFDGWTFAPQAFYAMWKYAELFGDAQSIYDQGLNKLPWPPPSDSYLAEMPHVHNAYIAGYLGFLQLEALAGYPVSADVDQEYNRLLALRASAFTKDTSPEYFSDNLKAYCRSLNISRNFMYLVPELAQYLHDNANSKVQLAVDEYQVLAPYWFVSRAEVQFGEGLLTHNYDFHALFQAKAQILQQPRSELTKYVDVTSVNVGDLFFIDNLVSAIEADN